MLSTKRLRKEISLLQGDPSPDCIAAPLESNILEWRFVLRGSVDTDYFGGYYHGILRFPPEYPYKPPSIMFITPNGRFALNQRICMSMSDFHPETWSPLWSVGSLLTGIVSFMNTDEGTVGSVTASPADRRNFALRSMDFNAKDSTFCALFGDAMTLFSRNDEILKAKSELRAMECAKRTKADAGKLNTMSKSVDTLILYEKKLGDEGDEIVSKSSDVSVELFTL